MFSEIMLHITFIFNLIIFVVWLVSVWYGISIKIGDFAEIKLYPLRRFFIRGDKHGQEE